MMFHSKLRPGSRPSRRPAATSISTNQVQENSSVSDHAIVVELHMFKNIIQNFSRSRHFQVIFLITGLILPLVRPWVADSLMLGIAAFLGFWIYILTISVVDNLCPNFLITLLSLAVTGVIYFSNTLIYSLLCRIEFTTITYCAKGIQYLFDLNLIFFMLSAIIIVILSIAMSLEPNS